MDFTVRAGTANDVRQISQLFCETVLAFDREYYTDAQINKWIRISDKPEIWQTRLRKDRYMVAENETKNIIGFTSLRDDGFLEMLYIRPSSQKQGVATKLLQSVCNTADDTYLPRIYTEASLASVAFFEKNGFLAGSPFALDMEGTHFTKIRLVKKLWL